MNYQIIAFLVTTLALGFAPLVIRFSKPAVVPVRIPVRGNGAPMPPCSK